MRFLTLGVLAGPLPNNIVDGMVADAAPVMANLQSIVDDINDRIGNYAYNAPVTGFSITMEDDEPVLILEPAGTLATGTIILPETPVDGMIVRVGSTKIITALTVTPNTGQSVVAAPSAMTAGGSFALLYRSSNTTWYPIS